MQRDRLVTDRRASSEYPCTFWHDTAEAAPASSDAVWFWKSMSKIIENVNLKSIHWKRQEISNHNKKQRVEI